MRRKQSEIGTHWLKRSNLRLPIVRRNVIDSQPPILSPQPQIRHLQHPLERSIPRLEIQIRRPIIAKIFTKRATRTAGFSSWVVSHGLHSRVERVAAGDLMCMCRGRLAGLNEWVDAFDY